MKRNVTPSPEQQAPQPADRRHALLRLCLAAAGLLLVALALYFFIGRPMIRFVGDTGRFRAWIDSHGIYGRLAFLGMMCLQIIVAFIPGEPLEIAAGYAFGAAEGLLLCLLGSIISWLVYSLCAHFNMNLYGCYFIAAAVVSLYAEIMARIRKYPATSYLLASLVPLIPGAGVYYTMSAIARNDMATFSQKGVETAAIAGSIAIGILLVSSSFRMLSVYKQRRACKKAAK